MNDLNRALSDITSIRRQMAQTAEFRGYGPAALTATGGLALAAGFVQMLWVGSPVEHPRWYLAVWIATAALSAALIAVEMLRRTRRIHTGLANEMLQQAFEQFLPAVVTGALVTWVLARCVPHTLWMLPGLWQVIYALGVFSSCRFLPKPIAVAGVWFLATGLTCLALGDARALSPWMMAAPYAIGQALLAGILWFTTRETNDEA